MSHMLTRKRERLWLTISIFSAFILIFLPWPSELIPWLPSWVLLVMIYWIMYQTPHIGLAGAWFLGLLVDVCHATLLGEHALIFVLVAYFLLRVQRQIRLFPMHQQILLILAVVLFHQLTIAWIHGVIGQPSYQGFWLVPFSSALCWPVIRHLLDSCLPRSDRFHHI